MVDGDLHASFCLRSQHKAARGKQKVCPWHHTTRHAIYRWGARAPAFSMNWRSPGSVLSAAFAAVPVMRYALGVTGLAAGVALVTRGFGLDAVTATVGPLIVMGLMAVLIVLAVAARQSRRLVLPAMVLTWAVLLLTLCSSAVLLLSLFFQIPRPLRCLVHDELCAGAPLSPLQVALGRLPTSVPALIGRKEELQQLEEAWNGRTRPRVVVVVAMGGQGKTTLVVNWVLRMKEAGFRGARRVFGWSFYSQGTSDERASSADEFMAAALKFFGDPDPSKGSPFDKADRLRDLVRRERSLLVLDGLEPLQYPPSATEGEGMLRDRALASLLADLAVDNPGLVVITTRVKLANLEAFAGVSLRTIALRPFSEQDGIALLKSLQVRGSDAELAAAVQDFRGHPLALTLLGNLLREAWHGEVSERSKVGPVLYDDVKGGQARRAMAAYDRWFRPGPERAVLRLLGLFDRPAPGAALQALRVKPMVPGLNEALGTLTNGEWKQVIARLRRAGLVEAENGTDPGGVDAHPLVREHFGEVLRKENEGAWREGNRRLYEWYASSTKELPDTAEEMAPLYVAVLHGCRAGRHQEVLDQVYRRRIQRFDQYYSGKTLGTIGAELSALSGFFEEPWTRPVPELREADRGFVLNEAGYDLRAVGRLEDAVGPMRAALEMAISWKDWKDAATAATTLSELQLALGQIKEATTSARQSVDLADRSGNALERLTDRTTLADAFHQGGRVEDAGRLFVEAEAMQRERKTEFPLLYSLSGYEYCDLLLTRDETEEVLRRADAALKTGLPGSPNLLDIGLDHLSLGRAYLARLASGHPDQAAPARDHLNQAVARLHEAGTQHHLPLGLIHRAAFFRHIHDFLSATRDLDEALRLATRGHMRLHEADVRLERTRLLLAQKRPKDAQAELALARAIVTQTGYARRDPEAAALAEQLGLK